MLYAEWDWDEYIAVQRREAAEDARDEERKAAIKVVEQARNEERKAAKQATTQAKCDTAKKALEMGLSPEQAAKLADLPVEEVKALVR